jgi:microcystin-dependent protein
MAFTAHQKASVGDIKFSAVNYSHLGWILCNGDLVNVADFEFLFNVIGYSFDLTQSGAQFRLPNPGGRVPGVIGSGNDDNTPTSSMTAYLGQSIGEYQHRLTIPEMPSHNHGVNGTVQISTNKYTSFATTGVYDSGHTHGLDIANNGINVAGSKDVVLSGGNDVNTASGNANIVDPGHRHELNPAGTDAFHNNVQPTLFIGNMFIYTGLPRYGASVYQTGKNLW